MVTHYWMAIQWKSLMEWNSRHSIDLLLVQKNCSDYKQVPDEDLLGGSARWHKFTGANVP